MDFSVIKKSSMVTVQLITENHETPRIQITRFYTVGTIAKFKTELSDSSRVLQVKTFL